MGEQWVEAIKCLKCEARLTVAEVTGDICPHCGALSEPHAGGFLMVPYKREAVLEVSGWTKLKRWWNG